MQERVTSGMPNLDLKVLIVGTCFLGGAIRMFHEAGCHKADSIKEADLVCFLGGADVNPELYGEHAIRQTSFSKGCDDRDMDAFTEAMLHEKPMFGICRGHQLLAVMNGSKLYQHVDGHAGRPHKIKDLATGEVVLATSLHHQLVIEDDSVFPLAYSEGHSSGRYVTAKSELSSNAVREVEAAVFPNINALGVQGHPELPDIPAYTEWCMRKVDEFMNEMRLMGNNSKHSLDVNFIKQSIKR